MPDVISTDLAVSWLGAAVEHHEVIDSTNRRALEWADAGAPHGAIVVTDHQTRGRGRRGRTWTDAPGQNLLFSVVLRADLPHDRLGLVSLAAGLGVADAIEQLVAPLRPELKWPNDVRLEGQKVCGILAEGTQAGERTVVALGIGLNVNQRDFPADLDPVATSLALATGRLLDRRHVLGTVLRHLEPWLDRTRAGDDVARAFEARMAGVGAPASVRLPDGRPIEGTISGVAADGALLLDTGAGIERFAAGDVSLNSPQS